MRLELGHWLSLIAVMVLVGTLEVSLRSAVMIKGYTVGSQVAQEHRELVELAWLEARVQQLTSPTNLARVARQNELMLVARETLVVPESRPTSLVQLASARLE